jgi:hypothetical protein
MRGRSLSKPAALYSVRTRALSSLPNYVPQVLQLPEEHELQEEPPPIAAEGPSLLFAKQAHEENTRLA